MEIAKRRLSELPGPAKHAVMVAADAMLVPAAVWLAFSLKYDSLTHGLGRSPWLYVGAVVASVLVFATFGLYQAVIRYIGSRVITAVVAGSLCSAAVLYIIGQTITARPVPASVAAIYALVALVWVSGSRFLARRLLTPARGRAEPVVIYGAGDAGARLAASLRSTGGLVLVAFLDDNETLQGRCIDGTRILSPGALASLVERDDISRVLLAMPTASRRRRGEIIRRIEELGVRVQTVPDLKDLVNGEARVEDIRDVDAGDLLGRDIVPPKEHLFETAIRGKVVMVTGAGGSIGSELCRQIARLGPSRLVLLEICELALYQIDRELRALSDREDLRLEFASLLGDVRDQPRMREIVQAYGVQTVYHAAAYKHVPIVEHNVIASLHNNVIGTWHLAETALECRVDTFVLVSTDKAVNPTNVMGATKRMAEMVLQGMQQRGQHTRFCMVRFGNVLESSGSVVPLFREQIRRGGPVTVTHPDVIRYFMTIPEAAQLVLQASAMAHGGDVFVLDMGQPVCIADVARRMIQLSGLSVRDDGNPDGDIEIRYTGLRPGEKLYEELLIGKNVAGTEHPMIMRALEHSLPWDELHELLQELVLVAGDGDVPLVRDLLLQGVQEFQPSGEIVDSVWRRRMAERQPHSNVTSLATHRLTVARSSGLATE